MGWTPFSWWKARNRDARLGAALGGVVDGGQHEEEIRERFSTLRFDGDAPVFDADLCILAFFNRSGSNLLGEYLSSLPGCGGFGESLNAPMIRRISEDAGIGSFPDYIRHLVKRQAGQRLWGVKAAPGQISFLLRWNIPAMFRTARIIHIRRNDLVAQAVSLHFAQATKVWTSRQQSAQEVDPDVEYDFDDLRRKLHSVQKANCDIEVLATVSGLPAQTILYEQMVARPTQTVHTLADFLGMDAQDWIAPQTRMQKQIMLAKSDMVARFRSDLTASVLRTG
ncbi:Stf0 family sulfotransferase [Lacimonas salitolerans]|uniref:Stf0 family sulfotransferase n=1 Tax=Lacimonas salitolerans TaxID=1323750 RepID=A0ABW4EDN2_9RHOB